MSKPSLVICAATQFVGGAELYISRLGLEISRTGADVKLLGRIGGWPDGLISEDISLGPKWSLRSLPGGLVRIPREMFAFWRWARGREVDAFNFHFKREQVLFSWIASRYARVVWTEHGRFPEGPFGFLVSPFYKLASRRADSVVCVSDLVRRSIARRVSSVTSLTIVDSSVDCDHFNMRAVPSERRAVVIGRIEESKRPDLAIAGALAAGCCVDVVGEGRFLPGLRNIFDEDARVTFVGKVQDVRPYYERASVHVFTSSGQGEGFPTVLLEAAASGVPSVVVDDCGFAAIAPVSGGEVARPQKESIARAISRCLTEPEVRSRAAREWALKRSPDEWRRRYAFEFFGAPACGRGVIE